MKIENIRLVDINPAEYNPRTITEDEYEILKENIEKYNLVDPLIINLKNNRIIGGHQRYKILLENSEDYKNLNLIRLGDIGWVFDEKEIKLNDEDDEKILNLALNKISGTWNEGKLLDLFDDLSLNGFDIDLTGFTNNEVVELELSNLDDYIEENNITTAQLSEDIDEMFDERKGTLKYELKFDTEEDYDFFMDFIDDISSENIELNATTTLINHVLNKIKKE